MNGNIILSDKFGVNPAIGVCPRCGEDNGELLLLGKVHEYECRSCKGRIVGKRPSFCPHCHKNIGFINNGEYEGRKIPSSLCDKCEEKRKGEVEEVEKGGVFWKCDNCSSEGIVKANARFSEIVREQTGVNPPGHIGVMITKEQCPVCADSGGNA